MSTQWLNGTELPQLNPACSQIAGLTVCCSQNLQQFTSTCKQKFCSLRILASSLLSKHLLGASLPGFTLRHNPTLRLWPMSTICSPFSSWLITSNVSSIPTVFLRIFTGIALGGVDLHFSLILARKASAVEEETK
jgi:hypothetical protein